MKPQYIASLLMMLGATQAELFATFATDTVCKQLYEEKLDVDNYECFKNFRGSGSISFSPVTENTTVCLEQFEGDHCETGASKHEMTLVAEADGCQFIGSVSADSFKSYKIAHRKCDEVDFSEIGSDMFDDILGSFIG